MEKQEHLPIESAKQQVLQSWHLTLVWELKCGVAPGPTAVKYTEQAVLAKFEEVRAACRPDPS